MYASQYCMRTRARGRTARSTRPHRSRLREMAADLRRQIPSIQRMMIMTSTVSTAAPNQFALARSLDDCAKWWWGASLTLKALGFATGILIFLPVAQEPLPFLVAALTILAELTIV